MPQCLNYRSRGVASILQAMFVAPLSRFPTLGQGALHLPSELLFHSYVLAAVAACRGQSPKRVVPHVPQASAPHRAHEVVSASSAEEIPVEPTIAVVPGGRSTRIAWVPQRALPAWPRPRPPGAQALPHGERVLKRHVLQRLQKARVDAEGAAAARLVLQHPRHLRALLLQRGREGVQAAAARARGQLAQRAHVQERTRADLHVLGQARELHLFSAPSRASCCWAVMSRRRRGRGQDLRISRWQLLKEAAAATEQIEYRDLLGTRLISLFFESHRVSLSDNDFVRIKITTLPVL